MKYIIAFISGLLAVYIAGAFIGWEWNPALWEKGSRAFLVLFGSMAGCLIVMGLGALEEIK